MTKLVNRAKMTTATTGTGTITLGTAESGYQSFAAAGVADADVVRYVIEDGTDWEIGTGTYTASGTTLTRTVSESSNADAALNLTGSAVVYVSAVAADFASGGGSVDVQEFTTPGTSTWTKPSSVNFVKVILVGGGGGGGAGAMQLTSSGRSGGSGGSGSPTTIYTFFASDLPSSVSVVVGSGGAGGVHNPNGFGSSGTAGTESTFGSFLIALGGNGGSGGGTSARSVAPAVTVFGGDSVNGQGSGAGLTTTGGTSASTGATPGGGGGGGAGANNTTSSAGGASTLSGPISFISNNGVLGQAGSDGTSNIIIGDRLTGLGGSGGGYLSGAVGRNGGNGGYPGCGGGGGSASDNGFAAGAGGAGGNGWARIISW
jgi:hypothetical protein